MTRVFVRTAVVCALVALAGTTVTRARQAPAQQPAAPVGPLATEKYKHLYTSVDAVLAVPVETIERHGGGSVRCMLAEVFLP